MTGLTVTGWGVICSGGVGPAAFSLAPANGLMGDAQSADPHDIQSRDRKDALADFNVRTYLGRKGTSFLDRGTGLALVACGQAIEDSELRVTDATRHRIGVVFGTTCGSLKSMSDYTAATMQYSRPYLVNPITFPNTVMNCVAGQAAIWYGLKGVNCTIAGERLAFLNALSYSVNALRCSHADAMLAGAVEELTPHREWATKATASHTSTLTGEAAAVFVLESSHACRCADRHVCAELLSVTTGHSPEANMRSALVDVIRRTLANARVTPRELSLVATGETGDAVGESVETDAVEIILGAFDTERIQVARRFGELHSASGAMQLAAILGLHRNDRNRDGQISLFTSCTRDGGIGAAVLRGWSYVGTHRE